MTAFKTAGPTAEPLAIAEAKAQLRIDGSQEDDFIAGLIRTAREQVERDTGTVTVHQDWRKVLDELPDARVVMLTPHPVNEILSVTVFGADGEGAVVDPSHYTADLVSRPARLAFRAKLDPGQYLNGIEIDYRAGHGEAGTDVPDQLKRAMLLLIAHWYEFRTAIAENGQPISLPGGYERLIAAFRRLAI